VKEQKGERGDPEAMKHANQRFLGSDPRVRHAPGCSQLQPGVCLEVAAPALGAAGRGGLTALSLTNDSC